MMNKFLNVCKAVTLMIALCSSSLSQASVADDFDIPTADAKGRVGALMPYTRYDSQYATLSGGASLKSTVTMDRNDIASQASDQSYVELPGNGSSAEWTMKTTGRGVTMRFTMPDSNNGMGQKGSLDVYVNDEKVKTVALNSYWMWQYFSSGNPSDTPGGIGCFAFDEVHFLLNKSLKEGDRIKIQSSGANGLTYGVDFLEIEEVPDPIEQPVNVVSVTDFGANPDDGQDDLAAFVKAVEAADKGGKVVYIPEGTWHLSGMWNIYCKDVKIMGAGIWYTNLQFTSDQRFGGGISGGNGSNGGADGYCKNLEFCHVYINSNLRSRYDQQAVYKCFMDVFTDGSVIHDVWEEHFECGFWFGDYNGAMDYSDGVKVINCRIRNNLADGVNFCQGTSNATVYNCSIRNNGDDGLAMWNDATMSAKDESNNVFAYNTIDFIWRAGGIAIYGGTGHKIYNNYIRDMFMASGIHLNTTFPGYKFANNQGITFENNILVHCGTNADSWNEDLSAIDLKQDVKNVTFSNTQIYNSPFDAIRTMTGPSNITFYDTKIIGTGLTGEKISYSCVAHTAGAIRYADGNVKFDGLEVGGYLSDKEGNNTTFPFWTDNNQELANSLGATLLGSDIDYTVPSYPAADGSVIPGGIVDPMEGVEGYDVMLTALSWKNQDGNPHIKEGDKVSFTATVKNESNVDIPAKAKIAVQVVIDGTSKLSLTLRDGLKAGETLVFTPAATWTATKGGHTAVATVDPQNILDKELSEDNNTRTKRFNAYEDENSNNFTAVTGGYDLVVTKVFVKDLDAIKVGDHLVMGAVIANAGDQDIPAGTKIGLQFQMDGKTYGTGFITWCDTFKDGLKSHATATLYANGGGGLASTTGSDNYFIASEGTHTFTAWIDDTNDWKEEVYEDNNKKDLTLNIPFGGTQYFDNPDVPDGGDVDPIPSQPEVVRTTTVNGVKYELMNGNVQVVGWDDASFPENGIVFIEQSVKIGNDSYPVVRIAGGYDDKLSGNKSDEAGAFFNCQKLQAIVLPDGLATIGDHAFKNSNLQNFNLPGTLNSIGSWAFENTKLVNVTLPWTISNLGEGAFYNIKTLTTVTWTANVWEFPNMVFNSHNIKDVYFTIDGGTISTKGDWTWNNNALPRFHTRPKMVDAWREAGYENIDDNVVLVPQADVAVCSFGFDVDFTGSGLRAYKGTFTGYDVMMTQVTKVGANNGFVVRDGKVGQEYTAKMLDNGDDCDSFENNNIWASINSTYVEGTDKYYFADGRFLVATDGKYISSNGAYFNIYGASASNDLRLTFENAGATGINGIQVSQDDEDAYYTLSGIKMKFPKTKGIYVHKGKKYIVK